MDVEFITHRIEGGELVGYCPVFGLQASVPLSGVARELAEQGEIEDLGEDEYAALDELDELGATQILGGVEILGYAGDLEIVGGFFSKAFNKVKKAVKKTADVAKKVVNNKLVQAAYQSTKASVPPPYNIAIMAGESTVRFGNAIAKGLPKAKALAPSVKAAAEGKMSLSDLERRAKALKVNPKIAREAAAAGKMSELAKKDPKAKAALAIGVQLGKAARGDAKAAQDAARTASTLENKGRAKGANIKGKSGNVYHVTVTPTAPA